MPCAIGRVTHTWVIRFALRGGLHAMTMAAHDANGIFKDDVGDELTTATIARMVALKTVGEVVRDLTSRHSEGRVTIDVRDGEEPVLRVSAVVETTSLKE